MSAGEDVFQKEEFTPRTSSVSSVDDVFGKKEKLLRTPSKKREAKNSNDALISVIKSFQKEMRDKFDKIADELADIKRDNENFKETLLQENRELKIRADNMQKEIEDLKDEKINLSIRVTQLEKALERDDRQKRKENIIIKGSSFEEENLKENIKQYIKEKLDLEIEVREAHLIGKGPNKTILAKLKDFNQKLNVLKNKRKLKNEKIYIQSDLTIREREVQNILKDMAKEERDQGNNVKIGYNHLIINNITYDWDEATQKLIKRQQKN